MIFHKFSHAGTYAFPEPIAVDFDTLPPIVSVVGKNGSGKSTLFDCLIGALYLSMPYRPGALHRNFREAGFIDLTWECNGLQYRSVVKSDPVAERTEASLFDGDGVLIAGPLARDYKRATESIVGPIEMMMASGYSSQDGGGALLTASRAERKSLLGSLLNLQKYVLWAAYAQGKVRVAETQLAALRARVAELGKQAEQIPPLTFRLGNLLADRDDAAERLITCDVNLQDEQLALELSRADLAALDPAAAELRQVEQELGTLDGQAKEAAGRRSKSLAVLSLEAKITAAVARLAALQTEAADAEMAYQAIAVQQQSAAISAQVATRQRMTALSAVTSAERDQERLQRQAGLLAAVPCGGEGKYAGCALLKDARAAHDSLPAAEAWLATTKETLTQTPEPTPLVDATTPLLAQKRALEAERTALAPLTDHANQLSAARARVEELDGQLAELGARQAAATARRDALAVRLAERPACQRGVTTTEGAVKTAQTQRSAAQATLSQVEREVGQVEGQLAAVRAAGEACAAAAAEVGPVEQDLSEWTLLQRALGPSGIPALLVDQACPELSRLTTDQLTTCFGEQVFSVALTTQRESAAGDKLLETLDVIVRRHGEPIDAALLSGGEKVLVSEALSLALAIYSAGRSGRKVETLLRDEVGAALDSERAPAYTAMLRRAAQLGGFKHVLFVTHNERAAELADARLEIADGRVTVS